MTAAATLVTPRQLSAPAPAPKPQALMFPGPLFANAPAPPDRTVLTDPEDVRQADERYALLLPVLEYRTDPARFTHIRLSDGRVITSKGALMEWVAGQHKISVRTLKRWDARYMSGGWAALADRVRSDKGNSRWFEKYFDAKVLACYVYLEQRQSIQCAWEAIKRDHKIVGVPADDLPSYETVRGLLTKITPTLRILAREGTRKYRESCAMYLSRAYQEASNWCWISDHMVADVECQNDVFPEQPWGTPIRLRFTCLLDFRSRMVVGYSWCWDGSSRSITTAMRRAVSVYGPPEVFYMDNGEDFKKVGKGAVTAAEREAGAAAEREAGAAPWAAAEMAELEKHGIMARLGISTTNCLPYHPQSKAIERFFRTLHERFDRKWWTYTGGTPSRRPDLTEAAMAQHRKMMQHGQVANSRHPKASLYIACFAAWLDEYHQTAHRGRGLEGRSPAEIFSTERNPNQKPVPEAAMLAMMLAEREIRVVMEGSITLCNRRYVGYDAESNAAMHRCNRTRRMVAYDPNDLEMVAILDENGYLLTWAKAEEYLAQSNSKSGAIIAASMQQRRHLEKTDRQTLRGITLAARQIGAKSEIEHLAEKAGAMTLLSPDLSDSLTHKPFTAGAPEIPATKLHSGDIADRLTARLRRNQS